MSFRDEVKVGMTIRPKGRFDYPVNEMLVEWVGVNSNHVMIAGRHTRNVDSFHGCEKGEPFILSDFNHGQGWKIIHDPYAEGGLLKVQADLESRFGHE